MFKNILFNLNYIERHSKAARLNKLIVLQKLAMRLFAYAA